MDEKLKKFAKLAIHTGVNLQRNQMLLIHADVECSELARLVALEAYQVGAKKVIIKYLDEHFTKMSYLFEDMEVLKNIPKHIVDEYMYYKEKKCARIIIKSSHPGLMENVNATIIQQANIANNKALSFYQEFVTNNNVQWTIIAAPNIEWAQKVFPNCEAKKALGLLWEAILKSSRVLENPINEWENHIENLKRYTKILNEYRFKKLHFKNQKGTDLHLGLIKNHIWTGGAEETVDGVRFAPNIPSEEVFTMPSKFEVYGKVVATKPLDYQGKLIEDFYLEFENGKVINFDAKKEKEALKCLIEYDEGSSYLGEVALISHNSPISKSNILFFNTLFDENASCHLALGRAYPMNVLGGTKMSKEDLSSIGSNYSLTHVDFMFGSEDMRIVGTKENGEEIIVFKNGNFII